MARRKNTDNNETRQKLLDAGFDLFTQYGFEGTTTRMIAQKADVPLSSISFYFGTKQALYESIVESIFHNVSTVFDDIYTELQAFLEEPVESSDRAERAWDYIRRLLHLQIETAFISHRKENILFIFREANFPYSESGSSLIDTLITKVEIPFARLLLIVSGRDDLEWAVVVSRTVNGSIIGLGEHPAFLEKIYPSDINQETLNTIKSSVFDFALTSIHAAVSKS